MVLLYRDFFLSVYEWRGSAATVTFFFELVFLVVTPPIDIVCTAHAS